MRALLVLGILLPPPGAELPLSPDLAGAASAAVAEVRAILFAVPEREGDPWTVRASGPGDESAAEVAAAVLSALAAEGVSASGDSEETRPGVVLEVERVIVEGREALLLRTEAPARASVLAPFVRKPWVRAPLVASAGGIACKGESEVETSEDRAIAGAIASGAGQLREGLARCGLPRRALERVLPDGEAARRHLADLFVRREGAGESWRASALFRAAAEDVRSLAGEAAWLEARGRAARTGKLVGLLGIATASFLLYLWLDFATAGRASGLVRLFSLGLAAAGAAVLL